MELGDNIEMGQMGSSRKAQTKLLQINIKVSHLLQVFPVQTSAVEKLSKKVEQVQ